MIEWRFKPSSKDDVDVDPIQGEFFTTRDIDNVSTAIIREGIQNALDEIGKDAEIKTVRIRIFLSGSKYAVKPINYHPLIDSLMPHLEAKNAGITDLPDFKSDMRYFVFEDFNTKGLEGNPEEYYVDNINDKQPHNFYYFWRNVGRSGKTDDQLGRWGLGKTVFPASSRINTFWGLTVRRSDSRKLLMGQSILRMHNRDDGNRQDSGFKPYGFFGNYIDSDFFALPIEKNNQITEFEDLFKLERKERSGLSLVVPFVTDEITINHLAYSVIEQYFYPILEGKLEVEIIEEDHSIILEKNIIVESIEKIDFEKLSNIQDKKVRSKDSLLKLFDFAKWTFQMNEDDYFKLEAPDLNAKPRWISRNLFKDDERMNLMRDKFENNERVAFTVPLKYHPVNATPKICWYNAFLERDASLNKPDNLYIREGITISGITSLDKGLVRGIVVIHDSDLARMIGDAENPAHTEWQPDSRNFKGKYVDGKEALVFIKNTLKKIYDQLQRPLEGIQKDLLIDFFYIPIDTPEEKKHKDLHGGKDSGKEDSTEPQIPEMHRKKAPLIVEKIETGLKIIKNPESDELPDNVRLKLGYDVPRGNPIKGYQELDFNIAKFPIKIESQGVYFTKKEGNELEFDIENKSHFEITLTGFDEKRDLFLKLQ